MQFFHIPTNKLKKELNGTGTTIKWVGACPMNPPRVAALSFDGVIKMWYIDDVEREDNDDVIDEGLLTCSLDYCFYIVLPKIVLFRATITSSPRFRFVCFDVISALLQFPLNTFPRQPFLYD